MPFAGYENFADCVRKNRDKDNPEAYCGEIKKRAEDNPKKGEKGVPKQDGSGKGTRANYNRGGCNDTIAPECIVKAINHYKAKYPEWDLKDVLKESFNYFKNNNVDDFVEDLSILDFTQPQTLDILLLGVAEQYQLTQDILTMDAEGAEATHLQELFTQLKQYEQSYRTPEAQALREQMGGSLRPSVSSVDVPFTIRNSETGAIVRGSVVENFDRNTKQLTPVSSSNVRGVGQFGDELLVQFHGSSRNPMRTYRYKMQSPEMAEEAYRSLRGSGSPGRWIWENIRGHKAGEKVTKNKLAPSLSPPGRGLNTIGGTYASLVEYGISNRVPVSRVQNFEGMSKQMKRSTSNPTRNPNTNSRVEDRLKTLRGERDKGLSHLGATRTFKQLPKLDFTIRDLTTDSWDDLLEWILANVKGVRTYEEAQPIAYAIVNSRKKQGKDKGKEKEWQETWSEIGESFQKQREARKEKPKPPSPKQKILAKVEEIKKAKKLLKEIDYTITELDDLSYDPIDFKEFKNKSNDFNLDFTIMEGPITRAGPFPYTNHGITRTYYKQWDNLKDVFSKLDYLPLIGSKGKNSHYANTIGFAYNFKPNEEKKQILADIVTLEDIDVLSDNYQPQTEGWEVSIGFEDYKVGNKQILRSADHLAMSLRNAEIGRCRAGGDPCYAKPKQINDQNLKEVVSIVRN